MRVTLLVGVTLMLLLPATAARAASFTVNGTSDNADVKPGDGICADYRTPPKCTLRAAIQESNALAGEDVIYLGAVTYRLTSALPTITGPLTIQGMGAGRTAIAGPCKDKDPNTGECSLGVEFGVLHVGPTTGALRLDQVAIRDGQTGSGGGIDNRGSLWVLRSSVLRNHAHLGGAGIYNAGYLYLQDSTVNNNSSHQGGGGGIYNGPNGYVEIAYSTVNHNRAVYGGGIHNGTKGQRGGTLLLVNSTISSNQATGPSTDPNAGGILNDGTGDAWLKSVTIAANFIHQSGQSGSSGGVYGRGNFYFDNTIMVGNGIGSQVWALASRDCGGQVVSLGGNLVGDPGASQGTKPDGTPKFSCDIVDWTPWSSEWPPKAPDQIGKQTTELDPKYGDRPRIDAKDVLVVAPQDPTKPYSYAPQLDDNGGTSCTHALCTTRQRLVSSDSSYYYDTCTEPNPAINAGWTGAPGSHPFSCETYDQRWTMRDGYCDIGAYEANQPPSPAGLGCTAK